MIDFKQKAISSCIILLICIAISLLSSMPSSVGNGNYIIFDTYSNSYAIEYQNESYLISDATSQTDIIKLQKYLLNLKKYKFNYVIALNNILPKYFDEYSENIVIFNQAQTDEQQNAINTIKRDIKKSNLIVLNCNQSQSVNNLQLILLQDSSSKYGIFIEDLKLFISLCDEYSYAQIININNNYYDKINVYFGGEEYFLINNQNISLSIINASQVYIDNNFQKSTTGNWTFSLNSDKLENIYSID